MGYLREFSSVGMDIAYYMQKSGFEPGHFTSLQLNKLCEL